MFVDGEMLIATLLRIATSGMDMMLVALAVAADILMLMSVAVSTPRLVFAEEFGMEEGAVENLHSVLKKAWRVMVSGDSSSRLGMQFGHFGP